MEIQLSPVTPDPPKYQEQIKQFSHDDLVHAAEHWLLITRNCSFALSELRAFHSWGEIPDSIGWKNGQTILVEAKANRTDFLSDKSKIFRRDPSKGMGTYRFYLCPTGIIQPEDLPERWGLLWINDAGKVRMRVGPKESHWGRSNAFRFPEKNDEGETAMLVSALRRLHLRGRLPEIYEGWDIKTGQPRKRKSKKAKRRETQRRARIF